MAIFSICVWVKSNGGMGSLYRSRHELIGVFKNGKARHRNNVELGRHGRNRTNVWTYPGVTGFGRQNEEGVLLSLHPTVKPVALVADAILDCSRRGYGVEIDPLYVDTTIARWEKMTGRQARHPSGKTFADLPPQPCTSRI